MEQSFENGRLKKNIHTDKCSKNGGCSYPESKKFTIDFEGVMFLSEAWLHPPQEGAHKKHISRSWQGCGRVDLDSNISSQIDTIPQTSVVRKPSGAPFHLLPPVLDDDHHSLKYPPTWNHWKDEDKPHVDITRKIRGVPRYDFCLIIRSLIPFSSLKFR